MPKFTTTYQLLAVLGLLICVNSAYAQGDVKITFNVPVSISNYPSSSPMPVKVYCSLFLKNSSRTSVDVPLVAGNYNGVLPVVMTINSRDVAGASANPQYFCELNAYGTFGGAITASPGVIQPAITDVKGMLGNK